MTPSQLRRREALADRSDAALSRWPDRVGFEFIREMSEVTKGLEALVTEADAQRGDRLERSRTWRFVGNAYSDLGSGKELPQMRQAAAAFEKAESLLEGVDEPIEQMKLNYSYGHALFHLSAARDTGLVEQALDRYTTALRLARRHLPAAVDTAQKALTSAERLLTTLQTVAQLDGRREELKRQLEQTEEAPPPAEWRKDFSKMFGQLQSVYQQDIGSGKVSSVRQEALNPVLEALGQMLEGKPGDLASLTNEGSRLRELMARVAPLTGQTSQGAALPANSRAEAVWSRFASIKKDLMSDVARPHSGSDERMLGMVLFKRCGHADTFVHQRGADPAWMRDYERDVLRQLAAEVRDYSRRYHLTLADPIWPSPPITPDATGVFFSGGTEARRLTEAACKRTGLTLLTTRSPKDYAAARWDLCRTSNVAVFDYTGYRSSSALDGVDLASAGAAAQVSYDLGIALTLGRPVVIIADDDQSLPFDVSIPPLALQGDGEDDARLADALDDASYSSRSGGGDSSLTASLDFLRRRFANHSSVVISQSVKLLDDESSRDPVVFRRFADPLLGAAGSDAPLMIFPAWPGSYPEPLEPRLFHVTPFGPSWAGDTMKVAARICAASSPAVEYVRGDRVLDPDIMRSIWDQLCRATHILVDLTTLNANVAFELGVAHVLGRNVLLVSQDESVKEHFPAIAKTRIHRYSPAAASGGSSLQALVSRFLE